MRDRPRYGVTPTDTATLVSMGLLIGLIGFVACDMPARRAAKVDPLMALKRE